MGTGLVGRVYGGLIRRYEAKGPLNVDHEIRTARTAAAAKTVSPQRRRRRA